MGSVFRIGIAMAMFILTAGVVAAQPSTEPADPQEGCTYYEETGHNLCDTFEDYWNANGGLPVFGYPITEAANEVNLDLGQEFLTQYFERERMELHPENAGTPYEVLLGRLGNEVLLAMDRDWMTFPKADPSAENYMAATGHAIAPEFYAYWSSNGLDLGDDGVSFRESLALFGYPISPAEMETNMAGDTVLTQWFERARFEYHPDNPEGQQVLLGLLGSELLELQSEPEPPGPPPAAGDVIATGLNSPRGLATGADGAVYVAESGTGGENCATGPTPTGEDAEHCFGDTGAITMISDGGQSEVVSGLPSYFFSEGEYIGAQDVIVGADGQMYAVMGLGANPAMRDAVGGLADGLGDVISINEDGSWSSAVDIAAYEGANNPDGNLPDSNPFSAVMNTDGSWVVSDSGANALLYVSPEGEISELAVFEDRLVDTAGIPIPDLPPQIPMQTVPTGVAMGPDGSYYVGELTGFPFVPGAARVWQVTPEGEANVYAEGFTNVIDVAFDGAGNLYVLELVQNGLLNANPEDPSTLTGRLVQVTPDGEQTTVASDGLITPTGLAIGADGMVYVSDFGLAPGMGRVQALADIAAPAGPPLPPGFSLVADGLNQPRGMYVDAEGTLYITETGVGGDECFVGEGPDGETEICYGLTGRLTAVADGETTVITDTLPSALAGQEGLGIQDVIVDDEGQIIGIIGLGADPANRAAFGDLATVLGYSILINEDGSRTPLHDIAAYESENNPDGGPVDSNPYSLAPAADGGYVVSDAGMNALLHVSADGEISTLAVFEPQMVDAPPFLEMPEGSQIPMESVPTGVVLGPDGNYYVGELTGFPFQQGAARVWQVTPDGEATVYAEGFTNVIDVAFDSAGNLYVLEMLQGGLLNANPEDPSTLAGRLTMVSSEGEQTVVADMGIVWGIGLAIGPDDTIYVAHFGVMPGMGQVVAIAPSME